MFLLLLLFLFLNTTNYKYKIVLAVDWWRASVQGNQSASKTVNSCSTVADQELEFIFPFTIIITIQYIGLCVKINTLLLIESNSIIFIILSGV